MVSVAQRVTIKILAYEIDSIHRSPSREVIGVAADITLMQPERDEHNRTQTNGEQSSQSHPAERTPIASVLAPKINMCPGEQEKCDQGRQGIPDVACPKHQRKSNGS